MDTQTIYYWQSGVWVDNKETAELAVFCLGFEDYKTADMDKKSDIQHEVNLLLSKHAINK